MGPSRILLADDHPVFLLGLRSLLAAQPTWQVCGEAADGREAVEQCRQLKPDLLILDVSLPNLNGADAARQIVKENPDQQILIVTDVDSEEVIRNCLDAGVRGWVFKSDCASDLTAAVDSMLRRRIIFSPRVFDLIVEGFLERHHVDPISPRVRRLSPREREVVQLLSEGKGSKEIAAMLGLTSKTVETHRSNIMLKLKVHSIAEVVLYAVRNEIVHVNLPVLPPGPQNGNSHAGASPQGFN